MRRAVLFVVALLTPFRAAAQQVTGDIHGRIVGIGGLPLADVQVIVAGPTLPGERQVLSDAHGGFRLLALPPGAFTVRLTRVGYRPVVIERVAVQLGATTSLGDLQLQEQAMELSPLVVTANRPAIDPMTATIGTQLSAQVFDELPVGRDYGSILTLFPQVNESYYGDGVNVAGGTGLENAYFVDGVNVTEPYRGDGGIDLPYNFIDHLTLQTGGYEADYARALGGITNVITKSGGDERRLAAFGFFTGSSLASSPERGLVDQGKGNYSRYDVGVSLGGPIGRNRLWYFLAYDAAVERQHVQIPGSEVALDHGVTHKFAAKLTWRANPATSLVLTGIGNPSTRDIVGNPFFATAVPPESLANSDPFLGYWNNGGVSVALRGDHLVGTQLHLESAISYMTSWQRNGGTTSRGQSEPLFTDLVTATWSGGYGNQWNRTSSRSAVSLTADWAVGEHALKGGVQYEDNRLHEKWQWLANGPDSAGWLERLNSTSYVALPLDFRPTVHNRVVSLFLQGSYRATPWLRLNPGLRWDGQFFSGEGQQGRSGSITDQVQPRVGVVFSPEGSGSQKVTMSYGRFYEQVPGLTASFWWGPLNQTVVSYPQDPRIDTTGRFPLQFYTNTASHLRGQNYDEFTLGYERAVRGSIVKARGVYRMLREILTTADSFQVDPNSLVSMVANPGANPLAFLPRPNGRYLALELTVQKVDASPINFELSYVLSRHYGNYVGLYDQDAGVGNPNSGSNFSNPNELQNATGLLPNDRTHVFKAFGSRRVGRWLTVGSQVTMQSGTPLNYLGAAPDPYSFDFVFLRPRGTAGRTPWLWDLNLRIGYELATGKGTTRIVLDVFHLFSEKRPVALVQQAFLAQDSTGQQINPNPIYGQVLARQPPMSVRLGVEIGR